MDEIAVQQGIHAFDSVRQRPRNIQMRVHRQLVSVDSIHDNPSQEWAIIS
jgi:hypothetical protein